MPYERRSRPDRLRDVDRTRRRARRPRATTGARCGSRPNAGLALIDSCFPSTPRWPGSTTPPPRPTAPSSGFAGTTRAPTASSGPGVVFLHGGGMILGSVAMLRPARRRLRRRVGRAVPVGRLPGGARAPAPHAGRGLLRRACSGWSSTPTSCESTRRASRSWATARAVDWRPASCCSRAIAASRSLVRSSCTRCSTTARPRRTPSSRRSRRGRTTTTTPAGTRCSATPWAVPTCRIPPRPARATDVSGLPPTFIDTGELDIFRDECIDYARRITATGHVGRAPRASGLPARVSTACRSRSPSARSPTASACCAASDSLGPTGQHRLHRLDRVDVGRGLVVAVATDTRRSAARRHPGSGATPARRRARSRPRARGARAP